MVAGDVLLPHDRNVVIGPIDGRPHQVGGAGIHPHILLVGVLLVEHPGHQVPVWGQHEAPQLGTQRHVPHARGDQDLLVGLPHPRPDGGDVVGRLLRAVGHPHAAGQVDEGDVAAGLLLQLRRQLEQHPGQGRIVLVGQGVGGQEGVDAELLRPQLLQTAEGLGDLGPGHAVLGLPRVVHDLKALFALSDLEYSTWIIPAGDLFGDITQGALQKFHMGDVIQIDGRPQLLRQDELLRRGIVGGEHDLPAPEAAAVGHHQLAQGGAVHPAALLPQDLQDLGIGGGLHREVLRIAGVPCKGRFQRPGVLPDAPLIIQVERGRVLTGDILELFQGDKRFFHIHRSLSLFTVWSAPPAGAEKKSNLVYPFLRSKSTITSAKVCTGRPLSFAVSEKRGKSPIFLLRFSPLSDTMVRDLEQRMVPVMENRLFVTHAPLLPLCVWTITC